MSTPLLQLPSASLPETQRYARCIAASKRIRWDIDRDVIRGRRFDFDCKFMPDGLSLIGELRFLAPADARLLSQVQGRTYANIFGLVERYISAKTLDLSQQHRLGDQVALEALVRMTDEELKHQELFRRLDRLAEAGMPGGYRFLPQPNEVAAAVLGNSTWAVLGLTLDIELFVLAHTARASTATTRCRRCGGTCSVSTGWRSRSTPCSTSWSGAASMRARAPPEREQGVGDLIDLVGAIDGLLQMQAGADAECFLHHAEGSFSGPEQAAIADLVLRAYRWQYIVSGVQEPRFGAVLGELVTPAQRARIGAALAPIVAHVAH